MGNDNEDVLKRLADQDRARAKSIAPHLHDPDLERRLMGCRVPVENADDPNGHWCLDFDGETRWIVSKPKPNAERLRTLEKTLTAQGLPNEAIETILWMDNEAYEQLNSAEDAKPVKRTRKRKPTLAGVSRQVTKAGIEAARYDVRPDGTISVVPGKPEITKPDDDSNEWDTVQ